MKWIVGAISVLLFSCGKADYTIQETPGLEQEIPFQTDSLVKERCIGTDCAKIRLIWPVAAGHPLSEKMNSQIQKKLIELLKFEEFETGNLESLVNHFFDSHREFKADFPGSSGNWEIDLEGKLSHESEHTISIYFSQYYFLGGAHPNSAVFFLNFDRKTGEIMTRKQLVLDEKKLMSLAEAKFREIYGVENDTNLLDDERFFIPESGFFLANAIGFKEGYLWIIYVPYEIAPYAFGYTELRFSGEELGESVRW